MSCHLIAICKMCNRQMLSGLFSCVNNDSAYCSNPSCFHAPEEERLVVADPVIVEDLQQCYQPRCDQRKAKM